MDVIRIIRIASTFLIFDGTMINKTKVHMTDSPTKLMIPIIKKRASRKSINLRRKGSDGASVPAEILVR